MTFNIALCDDEEGILIGLDKKILEISQEENIQVEIKAYYDPTILINDVKQYTSYYDIFILDIEMPEMMGIELAESIKELNKDSIIIFITGHDKYAYDAYQVRAFHYLKKPVHKEKLRTSLKEVITYIRQKQLQESPGTFAIRCRDEYVNIPYNEIIYFEKNRNKVNVICEDKVYQFYNSIKKLNNELMDKENFVQSHQGYIINADKIISFKNRVVILEDGYEIPVSRSNEKIIKKLFIESIKKL